MAFWSKDPDPFTASMVEAVNRDAEARAKARMSASELRHRAAIEAATAAAHPSMTTGTLGSIGVRPTALGTPSPTSLLGFDAEVLHHVANLLHQNNMTQQDLLEVVDTYMKVKRRADNG